jgi:glycerate dehydrogenase
VDLNTGRCTVAALCRRRHAIPRSGQLNPVEEEIPLVTRIVVLDGDTLDPGDNSWDPIRQYGTVEIYDRTEPDELLARAQDADIVITNKLSLSAETIAGLPKLKFIAVTATGYDIVNIEAARRRGIPVSNVPVYGTATVAQFTWALILELCHHVGRHAASVSAGEWTKCKDFCYWLTPQVELAGQQLGLVGYGRIARQVGAIGGAFGMQVSACGRPGTPPPKKTSSVDWLSKERLFAESDIVSLHCPLTSETKHMVNRSVLARMRRKAFLINTSRGGLVDEHDLAEALRAGQIAGAAVDVVSAEPIQADNPLLTAPNCLITPHMAWTTLAARRRVMQTTADNIAAFLAGKPQNDVT